MATTTYTIGTQSPESHSITSKSSRSHHSITKAEAASIFDSAMTEIDRDLFSSEISSDTSPTSMGPNDATANKPSWKPYQMSRPEKIDIVGNNVDFLGHKMQEMQDCFDKKLKEIIDTFNKKLKKNNSTFTKALAKMSEDNQKLLLLAEAMSNTQQNEYLVALALAKKLEIDAVDLPLPGTPRQPNDQLTVNLIPAEVRERVLMASFNKAQSGEFDMVADPVEADYQQWADIIDPTLVGIEQKVFRSLTPACISIFYGQIARDVSQWMAADQDMAQQTTSPHAPSPDHTRTPIFKRMSQLIPNSTPSQRTGVMDRLRRPRAGSNDSTRSTLTPFGHSSKKGSKSGFPFLQS